jgi:hypothetical protein
MSDPSHGSGDSPAVRLGRHLKRIRLAAGYTSQPALSARIGFVEDVIQKGETGKRVPSKEVFPAWIEACRMSIDGKRQILTDGEIQVITELREIARVTQGSIPEFIERYFAAEDKATFLRFWALILVPGPLQVEAYAQAMYDLPGIDRDEAAARVAVRMERQSIVEGPDAPQVIAVLHDAVLYFLMGSPAVMVAQLDHLVAMSQRPNVTIQVVRGRGAYWGISGPFQIASGPEIPDTLLLLAVEDQTQEDPALTRKALTHFEKIRGYALDVEDSHAALKEARDHWNSQQ